jgi:hypothetical protein
MSSPIYQQIVNLGLTYINGLGISYGTTTTLTIAPGQVRDVSNTFDIVVPSALTLNAAIKGVNGLDTGTFAASTMYYIYAIFDVTNKLPSGCLMSLSATTPTMPAGYSNFIRIGCWVSNGSTNFSLMYQSGTGKGRYYQYDSAPTVLSAGTATTFTALSLANLVPSVTGIPIVLLINYTPATAGNSALIRPSGGTASTAGTVLTFDGAVAAVAQKGQVSTLTTIVSNLPKIDYLVANGSDSLTLTLMGFTDNM